MMGRIGLIALMVMSHLCIAAEDHAKWIDAMCNLKLSEKVLNEAISTPQSGPGRRSKVLNFKPIAEVTDLYVNFPTQMYWMLQDSTLAKGYMGVEINRPGNSPGYGSKRPVKHIAQFVDPKRTDAQFELSLIENALAAVNSVELDKEFDILKNQALQAKDPALLSFYVRVCTKRRHQRLSLLKSNNAHKIAFAQRKIFNEGHWYANFGYRMDSTEKKFYHDGGTLSVLDSITGKVNVLLNDPKGAFRDPVVHFNGQKMLFAWRKGGTENYLLYEINVDGTGLRQVTKGKYDDFEPIYLPDGDIIFVSSRAKRWVNCYYTQVATIHRCDINGENIRRLSANIEHDNTPWLLNDGRVAYMRWEYVDRSQSRFHHLWVMNPDGTQQQVLFGNMHPGEAYLDAKPISGTKEIIMSNNQMHGKTEHIGAMTILTVDNGPDDRAQMKPFTQRQFRDPYPVNKDWFLAVWDKSIVMISRDGQYENLFTTSGHHVHEPRPVTAHTAPPVIPDRTDWTQKTGVLTLGDVRIGRTMQGVKEGEIDKLLILESLPKPVNWGGGVFDQTSISYNGTFTLERIVGTVPVYQDGSANFEVPANTPLILAALLLHFHWPLLFCFVQGSLD